MNILVSACLLGDNCKYSGGNNYSEKLKEFLEKQKNPHVYKICPECLCGFSIPREPIEYVNGTIIDKYGNDYFEQMEIGKNKIKEILDTNHFDFAILKAKSPSCGSNGIYDGSFTKTLVNKDGFAAEMIKKQGIKVLTENDL